MGAALDGVEVRVSRFWVQVRVRVEVRVVSSVSSGV